MKSRLSAPLSTSTIPTIATIATIAIAALENRSRKAIVNARTIAIRIPIKILTIADICAPAALRFRILCPIGCSGGRKEEFARDFAGGFAVRRWMFVEARMVFGEVLMGLMVVMASRPLALRRIA
jgi:hypothetical protein